ncbi:hypothetical protein B0H14DRAFT_2613157 [Mycena olivaceomarginata]|nr:hypothetical protein B0H14DRAFT_2613157 [Mycena olivaceomarginata]
MIRASLTSGALGRFFFGTRISAEIVGDSWRNEEEGIGSAGMLESPGNSGAWSEVSKMRVLGRVYSEMNKSNQGIRYWPRGRVKLIVQIPFEMNGTSFQAVSQQLDGIP